jgi:hypothetical protein
MVEGLAPVGGTIWEVARPSEGGAWLEEVMGYVLEE